MTNVPSGRVVWLRRIGGTPYQQPRSVGAASDHSAYVAGNFGGSVDFEPSGTLTSMGSEDVFAARYDLAGNLGFIKQAGGTQDDVVYAGSTTSNGATSLVGTYAAGITFGAGEPKQKTLDLLGTGADIFVATFAPSGDFDWVTAIGADGSQSFPGSLNRASDGSVAVTGLYQATVTFAPGESKQTTIAQSGQHAFVAKYDSNGGLAWARAVAGTGGSDGRAVSVLSDGSVIVVGGFSFEAVFGQGESTQVTLNWVDQNGATNLFVAKYAPNGDFVWVKQAVGEVSNLATLSDGSSMIVGYFSTPSVFGQGEANETHLMPIGNTADMFLARFNTDGTLAWARGDGGFSTMVRPFSMASGDGFVLVAGEYNGSGTFGHGDPTATPVTSQDYDAFVAKYSTLGVLTWAVTDGGPGHDQATSVALTCGNVPIVTGAFEQTAHFDRGFPTEFTLTAAGQADGFVARLSP